MTTEYRFILADFRCIRPGGAPRLYEAGRSYPMPPGVAQAAAKRGLVAKAEPPASASPGLGRCAEALTGADIAGAGAELEARERHAIEDIEAARRCAADLMVRFGMNDVDGYFVTSR